MEDNSTHKERKISPQEEALNKKFARILELDQKSKNIEEFNFLNDKGVAVYHDVLEHIAKKIVTHCSKEYEKLIVFSRYDGKEKGDYTPEKGYEKEFRQAEVELGHCRDNFQIFIERIEDGMLAMRHLGKNTYKLCLESCKEEMKVKNLSENNTKNCLNGCYRYLLMTKESFSDYAVARNEYIKHDIDKYF